MKKTNLLKKILSIVVCIVLIAATGLVLTSCDGADETKSASQNASSGITASSNTTTASGMAATGPADGYGSAPQDIGEGKTSFIFRVTDLNGNDTLYRVYTDKKTVGEALQDVDLIAGENGEYGLYVKVVNGITADYDADKTYWAFYINNEYAMTGVDKTDITPNTEYSFKIEKG